MALRTQAGTWRYRGRHSLAAQSLTSFSGAPVGSEGVSQESKESMPTSLLACMFHVGF